MRTNNIAELLDEDISQVEDGDVKLGKNFTKTEDIVHKDVTHVENRLSNIQLYISSLDTQVNNIKQLIQNEKDPAKKGKLYGVLNNSMELIVKFQDLYLKAMDIRYKYRREQVDFLIKKTKLIEIDLRKYKDLSSADLNTSKLVQLIMNIQTQLENYNETGKESEIHERLKSIEEDDRYKI